MKAELIRRMIRAIGEGAQADLDELAKKVISSERQTGHTRLATQLERIFSDSASQRSRSSKATLQTSGLRELPVSRRHGEQLISVTPRDELEHHMVLPPDTEARFARIEREFAARERLDAYGLRPRKTILLYGPPGCGKSLGAKRLAWNTGLPLLKARFESLLSSYFGESAANLGSVFEAARQHPGILLLDECDFIARSRVDSRDVGEASRIVNSLLQLMEDYNAPGLLVATTNIEGSLDKALFRRFDEVLAVPLPGDTEIEKLLKLTLSSISVDKSVNWSRLVDKLKGSSAAFVVKVARDAAKAVILNGTKVVGESDLIAAVDEVDRASKG